ncbi:MAG TPA: DUF4342 domain-containing protein [Trueperaceae bacterium]|nr:DUF4342 domain-containing protein [Trueperaceae bacterium]
MTDTNDMHEGTANQGATGTTTGAATTGAGASQPRQGRNHTEEFRVSGEAVLSKVRELVHEGNVRRITIKNDDGRVLIEIPLTLGVIGTVLLPVWAAIGAIAALAANLTIAVERADSGDRAARDTGSVEKKTPEVTG